MQKTFLHISTIFLYGVTYTEFSSSKLLSKSREDYSLFGSSPYQELLIILENHIIEGNTNIK